MSDNMNTREPTKRKTRPSSNKGKRFPVEVLTQAEISRLLNAFPPDLIGCRNQAICAVLLYSQARCTEMRDLRPVDLDLREGTVTILRGKGGKRRVAALGKPAVPYVRRWLQIRPESRFLFCTQGGRRLDDSYLRKMVRRHAKAAGIAKRVSPHVFRHSGAFHLANSGVDLRALRLQLGHSSLAVTDRYVCHLSLPKLVATIRATDW